MEIRRFDGYFIEIDPRGFGNVLALTRVWESSYIAALKKHDARVIRLSEYNGWRDCDISFLSEVPFLEGVEIVSDKVTDVRPLEKLPRLRKISLASPVRAAIDFSKFPQLQDIFLRWRKAYGSVFGLSTFKRINLLDYPEPDLTVWSENNGLRELQLQSKILESLAGIQSFKNIRALDLYRCPRLNSLTNLSSAKLIQKLELDHCPGIADLTEISELTDLRELILQDCGEVRSITPIKHCRNLETLQMGGNTTVVDGEIAVLATLPKLKRVLLAHRKHYRNFPVKFEN